jgi:hypothetical protein
VYREKEREVLSEDEIASMEESYRPHPVLGHG